MKTFVKAGILSVMLVGLLATAGCGNKADKATKAYVNNMGRMADAIEGVKDEKSARKAAKEIAEVAEDMQKLVAKYDDLKGPELQESMKKYGEDLQEVQQRITTLMMNLASKHPEAMQVLTEEMSKMPRFK